MRTSRGLFPAVLAISVATMRVTIAPAATLTVGAGSPDYPTVASALDSAMKGDTIEISSGTYIESLETSKNLVIRGIGEVILSGDNVHQILSLQDCAQILLDGIIFEGGYTVDAVAAVDIRFGCIVRIIPSSVSRLKGKF